MASDLKQEIADYLIGIEKIKTSDDKLSFPIGGEQLRIPLQSRDLHEEFFLDINRSSIKLSKATLQERARKIYILVRIDLDGPDHRNPDGERIGSPHIHIYREGYGDKWASPLPIDIFTDTNDLQKTFEDFMRYCNIVELQNFQYNLNI